METTALTDNKLVMYTSEQVQQMLDMVVRSLSRQELNNAPVNLDNVINQVTPSDAKITLTVTEAAEMLGISLPKMYEIVRMGRIPSIRVGKKIVISRQAVLDWLKEGDSRQWQEGAPMAKVVSAKEVMVLGKDASPSAMIRLGNRS